jgi:hypothetical protein
MDTLDTQNTSKNTHKFYCESCHFGCCKLGDWKRHIATDKHKKIKITHGGYSEVTELHHVCICGKKYKYSQGLSKHKKMCNKIDNSKIKLEKIELKSESEEISDKKLIMELLKSNNELQKQIIELCKEKNVVTNNNNCNNNNTNNFNLQFFLNEQCKDALNIMDFINQLKLNTTDLDMVGRVGYSEGISKLFIRGLKELDVFKRPVHCSDLKREVLYVKDKDSWEKDNEEKNKMKNAIKYIAAKNFKQINEWREKNPESDDYDSKRHMDYHQIVIHSMGGSTKEEDEHHYNKIIRNVAKEVIIDKSVPVNVKI